MEIHAISDLRKIHLFDHFKVIIQAIAAGLPSNGIYRFI
jgi:hypothetical protein